MFTKTNSLLGKILIPLSYLGMIGVNWMANAKPINGKTTGQVSDAYGNLFAPTGFTFAIWGLIYLLLAGYVLYYLGFFRDMRRPADVSLLENTGIVFVISSAANAAWIYAWHYDILWLSMVLMVILLICLIAANRFTREVRFDVHERYYVRLPFSVYFGWITVATVANATVLLVSLKWDGFGISENIWTAIILSVAALIGIATMLRNKDFAYGLVFVWAYSGILYKHTAQSGFDGRYPLVITVVTAWIVILVISSGLARFLSKRR